MASGEVAYRLRINGSDVSSSAVELPESARIIELRRRVAAEYAFLQNGQALLDVYPPGSTPADWADRSRACDPFDDIRVLLSEQQLTGSIDQRRFVVVARPPPALAAPTIPAARDMLIEQIVEWKERIEERQDRLEEEQQAMKKKQRTGQSRYVTYVLCLTLLVHAFAHTTTLFDWVQL